MSSQDKNVIRSGKEIRVIVQRHNWHLLDEFCFELEVRQQHIKERQAFLL